MGEDDASDKRLKMMEVIVEPASEPDGVDQTKHPVNSQEIVKQETVLAASESTRLQAQEMTGEVAVQPAVPPEAKGQLSYTIIVKENELLAGCTDFTEFIGALRYILASHPNSKDICDHHQDTTLSSSKTHPLLANPRADDQQPVRWIHVKLEVVKESRGESTDSPLKESTASTTLVMRDDNVDVMGFSNQDGIWYEIGNNRCMLPQEYSSVVRLNWGNSYKSILAARNKEEVIERLTSAALGMGKTSATHAVRLLSSFNQATAEADVYNSSKLALVGLMFMISESAKMNPVHDAIANDWDTGKGFSSQLMTDYVWRYVEMSRRLRHWKRGNYAERKPDSELSAIFLVLNVHDELVYTIGDEISFISFMTDLRRKLAEHPHSEDILGDHKDPNLSKTGDHPVLAKQRASEQQPARWIHVTLQVVEGDETWCTTLFMRDDNLYVCGFMNQKGDLFQLLDDLRNASTNMLLPITSGSNLELLRWGVSYRSMLGARSKNHVIHELEAAHLGRDFAKKAVREMSSYPPNQATGNDDLSPSRKATGNDDLSPARKALAGLIFIVCESARMNRPYDSVAHKWTTGTGFTENLMKDYVWQYGNMSRNLMAWKTREYACDVSKNIWKPHPILELQTIYLVLNTPAHDQAEKEGNKKSQHGKPGNPGNDGDFSNKPGNNGGSSGSKSSEEASDADSEGRSLADQPDHAGDDIGNSSGGSASQPEEAGAAGISGGQPGEAGDPGPNRGNNGGQLGHGRARVELLAIHADLRVKDTEIIVFDGRRGQIIYRKDEEEQQEQGMMELILTGPYKGISAYGCFAITIDTPPATASSSSGYAGGLVQWEWDCYDPKYAAQVDQPPKTQPIYAPDNRLHKVAEVTYAVMSDALEATVQVRLRLKDGPSYGGISGEITARIDGFESEHRSVLFRPAKGKAQCFSTTNDNPWFFLELARNVVAVPCGRVLHIEANLHTEPDDGNKVKVNVSLSSFDGICSTKTDDGHEVKVDVTWYPEISRPSHPPEQITTIEEADQQKFITAPSEQSGHPSEVKMVYTIGDELSFTEFIVSLRRILADHPDREDVLDRHKSSILSSTGEHPVLAKQSAEQPPRWIHIKLQAVKGEETSSITLIMRADNLYVCGFMNQQGDSFELIEHPTRSADILPADGYNPRPRRLSWGVGYKSLLGPNTMDGLTQMLSPTRVGRDFAMDAVQVLSRFPAWVENSSHNKKPMNPRMALARLIFMVCESARMNNISKSIACVWSQRNYINTKVFSRMFNYGRISGELLVWKSKGYANPCPISQLHDIYLVLNCRLGDHPPQYRLGRPRVELLAMSADLGVDGTTVTVFDGKQGHIVYRQDGQGENKGKMVDLVLTGPYTRISAYGCFAIKIDIPRPYTSTGDGRHFITWEWDCYNPECANEVDKPPVCREISSGPRRTVKVTYAVISNALDATVQVKVRCKDSNSSCSVHGLITAHIGDFKDQIILFKRTQQTAHHFSPTHSNLIQLARSLKLARNVVAVPYGHQRIDIEMHLNIETSKNQGVSVNDTLIFDNRSLYQRREVDGYEFQVSVAWYLDSSINSPAPIRLQEERQPDISYMIGDDEQGFTSFITELRTLAADHPRCKDLMAGYPDPELSTRNHPVLRIGGGKKRFETSWIYPRESLIHIKLEAVEGEETLSLILIMRVDNLDIIGFINHNGDCYELRDNKDSNSYRGPQLPLEYRPQLLQRDWVWYSGRTQGLQRAYTKLGKTFAAEAVRELSRFHDNVNKDGKLLGLMVMVCDSARIEPVRDAIAHNWDNGTELNEQLNQYIDNWPEISGALLDWRDHAYQEWPQNTKLELIGIKSSKDALKVVPLVFNDQDRICPSPDY